MKNSAMFGKNDIKAKILLKSTTDTEESAGIFIRHIVT